MLDSSFQEFLKSLSTDEKEQEAFMMLGVIFTLLLFALLGIVTGKTLVSIF